MACALGVCGRTPSSSSSLILATPAIEPRTSPRQAHSHPQMVRCTEGPDARIHISAATIGAHEIQGGYSRADERWSEARSRNNGNSSQLPNESRQTYWLSSRVVSCDT